MAQHAQESLLHGIFSIRGIAQHGIGDAIEGSGVLVDQRRIAASSARRRASSFTALVGISIQPA